MKYIFTGGGTLGHTNPAIAVAEKIREMDNNAEILFVMRKAGKENLCVKNRGFEIAEIDAVGLERTKGLKNTKALLIAASGVLQCNKIFKRFKPDLVFGTGGYVSFAPLLTGIIKKIPTFIHESNSVPGLVTKIMAKMGATVLVNLESTKTKLPDKTKVFTVGNPLLPEFDTISRSEARRKLNIQDMETYILSFGGSGGSKIMNETIYRVMADLFQNKKIRYTHICGERYFEEAEKKFPEWIHNGKFTIRPRINDMATHMKAADIVICRCGAMTISEIIKMGKAAILIPSPNVTDNHQYENGLYLKNHDAAILIEEKDLTKELLLKKIELLMHSTSAKRSLEGNIKKVRVNDSAKKISTFLINAR